MLRAASFYEFPQGTLFELLLDAYGSEKLLVETEKDAWKAFDTFVFTHKELMAGCGFVTVSGSDTVGFISWDPRGLPARVCLGHNCVRAVLQHQGAGGGQLAEACRRIRLLNPASIEVRTGNTPFFLPARRMYESAGLSGCLKGTNMITIAYVNLDLFSLIVLAVVFFNARTHSGSLLDGRQLFYLLLFSVAAELVLDTFQWWLNGAAALRAASIAVALPYSAMTPLPCYLWSLYADFQVNRSPARIRRLLLPLGLPLLVIFALSAASVRWGLLFRIDSRNVYHRGTLFFLLAGVCFFYLAYTTVYLFIMRRKIERRAYVPLVHYAVLPLIGGFIQSLLYGISIVWSCTTISILTIYLNLQNTGLYTDHLTGLFNRRQLDRFLTGWVKAGQSGLLGGIMLDLDAFKHINDAYGHSAGDRALLEAGKLIRTSFRKDDLVCRYGGDEFVVAMELSDRQDMLRAVERFKANVAKFNGRHLEPFSITFSIGFDILTRGADANVPDFLRHIDALMYEEKREKKQTQLFPADKPGNR